MTRFYLLKLILKFFQNSKNQKPQTYCKSTFESIAIITYIKFASKIAFLFVWPSKTLLILRWTLPPLHISKPWQITQRAKTCLTTFVKIVGRFIYYCWVTRIILKTIKIDSKNWVNIFRRSNIFLIDCSLRSVTDTEGH